MFILLSGSSTVFGQHSSPLNRFTIDYIKGCTGMTINVTSDAGWSGQYWYDGFDSSIAGDVNNTHVYTASGDYYVVFLGSLIGDTTEEFDSLLVEVVDPNLPEFTLHNCSSHNVMVEIEDDYYDQYVVDFTNTDSEIVGPLAFSSVYNYGAQGNYRIDVSGEFIDGNNLQCGTDNKTINTINAIIPPELTSVETTDEASLGVLQLGFTLGSDIIYNLESSTNGSDNFIFESEISGSTTTFSDINTLDQYYCYKINTYDACNVDTIYSDVICSLFFDVTGTEDANTVTWLTDTTQANSYNIIRDGNLLTNITNTSITSYDDSKVICNREYVYNVQAVFNTGSSVSVDTAVIASKSESLPAVGYPFSTVQDNMVELTWGPPDTGDIPFRRYIIEKNIRDRSWKTHGTSEDTTYIDTDPSFFGKHAYRIRYDDDCGNLATPSPSTVPVIIHQGDIRGKEVSFDWNKYEIWLSGIRSYTLERVDVDGNLMEEFPVLAGRESTITFSPNDSEDKLIRVRAESLDPTPVFTYSNVILTQLNTEMYLPNAFTPDEDGVNDRFVAKGPLVFNFRMDVYSRWGALIFTTTDNFNGWDGKINDEEAPEGTYIYKIYFEDAESRVYDQTGSMYLMRKK